MEEINVKQLRKKLSLSQSELADLLGVHYRTIQNWESGGVIPQTKRTILCDMLCSGATIKNTATGNSQASVHISGHGQKDDAKVDSLLAEIESLKAQLAEEKARSAQYWEMIQKLMK